jgi:hypothetical protein
MILVSNVSYALDKQEFVNEFRKGHDIIGVELLLTARGAAIESRFGHALIRLVDSDNVWTNDTVISFVADQPENETSMYDGIVGEYAVTADIKTLHLFWKNYTEYQDRGFIRYPLVLRKDQLDKFLDRLMDLIEDESLLGNYKFFTNNCVSMVAKMFNDIGLTIEEGDKQYLPTGLEGWINDNLYFPYIGIETPNFKNAKEMAQSLVDSNTYSLDKITKDLSPEELAYIYSKTRILKISDNLELADYLNKNKISIRSLYKLKALPRESYSKVSSNESDYFSSAQLGEIYLKRFRYKFDRRLKDFHSFYANAITFNKTQKLDIGKIRSRDFKDFKVKATKKGLLVKIISERSGSITVKEIRLSSVSAKPKKINRFAYELEEGNYIQLIRAKSRVELYFHSTH